jgi:deoxyribodipyrimidine photolyase
MLNHTGWLNFRMRAMLVSVASYPLWLHWQPVGIWLARQFLGYEPGIHWSQMQMQAGTTGINTTRVYNPLKKARDHDPQGHFVRHWLPALRRVPNEWLFEPWRMPLKLQQKCGVIVGVDIAEPLVDLESAHPAGQSPCLRSPWTRRGQSRQGSHRQNTVRAKYRFGAENQKLLTATGYKPSWSFDASKSFFTV